MFQSILSWLPIALAVGSGSFVLITLNQNPTQWKLRIIVLFALGLTVCILAALRDGYGFKSDSVISFTGIESMIFSILGASVFVLTAVGLFSSDPNTQANIFKLISLVFLIKLIAMESIRFLA